MKSFSLARIRALLVKEFIQMRRDRMTFGMIVGIPIMQTFLFGFAINADPKHLPTAVSISDPGVFAGFDHLGARQFKLLRRDQIDQLAGRGAPPA